MSQMIKLYLIRRSKNFINLYRIFKSKNKSSIFNEWCKPEDPEDCNWGEITKLYRLRRAHRISSFSDLEVVFREKKRASPKYLPDMEKPKKYDSWSEEPDFSEYIDCSIHQQHCEACNLRIIKIRRPGVYKTQIFNWREV